MRVNHYVMVSCLVFGILVNIYVIIRLNIGVNIFEYLQKIQNLNLVPKCEIDMDNLLNFIDNRHFLELEEKEMRKETAVHEKTIQTMLFAFPGAGLGNKLFEVISLLGIAETLQRSPVINATNPDYVSTLSKNIQPIFPKLVEQFQLKIIPFTAIAHEHTNWGACCKFDNPAKFINRSEQHIMLDGHYFQSYKYFHHMRPKIREWLAPSKLTAVRAEILLPAKHRDDLIICTHVRRGDFQYDGVHQPSDATFTRAATDFLVEFYRTENYKFLQETNGTRYNYTLPTVSPLYTAVLTPTLTPEIDLGFSRLFCDVTLITAPSSTFGWWLSYLSKRKSTTYYRDITESKDGVIGEMREEDFYPPEWVKLKTDQFGRISSF
ncbi:hypothetical protein CRE_15600 [Caenorhabditis remanei]|uniref:Uncharacterized protein n=1 Tax=Caenorhabditis remanei TaxID=31234 RepID=E3N2P7_CAERE|nr:hypothetical protein CRE_15600 [Caenorhabditis remanei]